MSGINARLGLNNPLNIRPGDKWQGLAAIQPSQGYLAFEGPEWCYRAGAKILDKYRQRGLVTIPAIVGRWAPAADGNDPAAYTATVCRETGFARDRRLDLTDPVELVPLLRAMTLVEQGAGHPYTDEQIRHGLELAGLKVDPLAKLRATVDALETAYAGLSAQITAVHGAIAELETAHG